MAVAVVLDFKDGTLDQYDQIVEKLSMTPEGAGAPGGLFHWVAKTDDGIRVTDVWESKERFEAFAEEYLAPKTAEVGVPNPPTITFYDVHNYLTAG